MTMRLLALGVGDAFSALHYSTCFALESDGKWLLIDCPHPIRKMLREAATHAGIDIDLHAIDGVVVTHLHADHASGLESLGYFNRFALGRKTKLLAHPEVAARLWSGHLAAGMEHLKPSAGAPADEMNFDDYFEHVPLDTERSVTFGPFEIECRRTIHHVPTTALRIRAGGRTLGYSADTTFEPGLIEWLSPADLVLHETGYGIHTPHDRLKELPAALRAKMRLVHYPDELDVADEVIQTLAQGETLNV